MQRESPTGRVIIVKLLRDERGEQRKREEGREESREGERERERRKRERRKNERKREGLASGKRPRAQFQHASVCRFKTHPCVPARRPHVFNTRAFCRYTRRRFECTHGGVLNLSMGGFPLAKWRHTQRNTHYTQAQHQHKTRRDKTRHDTTRHDTHTMHTHHRHVHPHHHTHSTHTRVPGYVLVRQLLILRVSAQ